MATTVKVCMTISIFFVAVFSQTFISQEESLRTALLSGYTTTVRPSLNTSVSVDIVVLSLNELDIGSQSMSLTTIVSMSWDDTRLTWTPSSYGGISAIAISHKSIWFPAVVVENAIEDLGIVGGADSEQVKCRVYSTGNVVWNVPIKTTTHCFIRIAMYPFDTQNCYIRLTGLGESTQEVDIRPAGVHTDYYQQNGEWDLIKYWSSEAFFEEVDDSVFYRRINFHFKYRRQWEFWGLNLVMPIVLTSILMCAVFALPIESGEKMGFSLTVLLSYVVFLTWVTDNLPAISTDTSVLQVYLALIMCQGVAATLLTNWVLNLYHREDRVTMSKPMKLCIRKILIPMYHFRVCLTRCQTKTDPDRDDTDQQRGTLSVRSTSKVLPIHVGNSNDDETRNGILRASQNSKADGKGETGEKGSTTNSRERLTTHDSCKGIVRREAPSGMNDDVSFTWQQVAVMFDWFFLVVFSMLLFLWTVVILIVLYVDYHQ